MCVLVELKSFSGSGKSFVSKFVESLKDGIERTNFEVSSHALNKLSANHKDVTWIDFVKKWVPRLEKTAKLILPECDTYICIFKEILNILSTNPHEVVDTFEAVLNFINDISGAKDTKVILIVSEFQQVNKVEKYGTELRDSLFGFFNKYKSNKYRFWTIVESSDSLYAEEQLLWRDTVSYDFVEVSELTESDIKSVLVPRVVSEDEFKLIYEKIGGVGGLWKHVVRELQYLLEVENIKVEDAISKAVQKLENNVRMGLELQARKWEKDGFKQSLAKIQSTEGVEARLFQIEPYYSLIKSNILYVSNSKLIPQNKVVAQAMEKLINDIDKRAKPISVRPAEEFFEEAARTVPHYPRK